MIPFESFTLDNGLKVIVHEDHSTPMAAFNLLYKVGARDEHPEKTGFAHLFEHLMFGGSRHVPQFDEPLQRVGGDNNAFTSNDITNYYITLPAVNLETAFWLESDRMLSLSFDPKVLEVQRSVVIEEFKQRYLNQPYGDAWLKLRPLAYKKHPYRWATIGKEIAHIEQATMADVKEFFYTYYLPNNAVLVVAGDISLVEVQRLAEKWFGPIPAGAEVKRNIPPEPVQSEYRQLEVEENVPVDALYMTFHMPGRTDPQYHATDLLSDVLGRGKSSRLYQQLLQKKRIFNSISAHVSGSVDPGLLVIEGKLNGGHSIEEGEEAIWNLIEDFKQNELGKAEVEKVKNKAESTLVFSELELLNRAMNLAYAEMLGDANLVNQEREMIRKVRPEDIQRQAEHLLVRENASVLRYKSNQLSNEN
jgi:zinc protease